MEGSGHDTRKTPSPFCLRGHNRSRKMDGILASNRINTSGRARCTGKEFGGQTAWFLSISPTLPEVGSRVQWQPKEPVDTASYLTSRVCKLFQVDLKIAAEMPLDEVGIHSGVRSLPAVVRTPRQVRLRVCHWGLRCD
jgi:hypothetical protein